MKVTALKGTIELAKTSAEDPSPGKNGLAMFSSRSSKISGKDDTQGAKVDRRFLCVTLC